MGISDNLETDLTANMQMNWGAWLNQCRHSHFKHVEDVWVVDEIEYDVAFSRSLGVQS